MNISHVTNAQRVGHLGTHDTHDRKLTLIPDAAITTQQLKNETGRVYFLTVDGDIKKIGGSQSKGGIQATIGAYLGGFAPGMSPRSYCGWNYCRQQIQAGHLVEFWFILAPTTTAEIPTMNGFRQVEIALDFHQIESACVQEYVSVENDYPYLNMQESGRKWIDTGLLEGYPGIIDTGG
jgi:hypothetical protein